MNKFHIDRSTDIITIVTTGECVWWVRVSRLPHRILFFFFLTHFPIRVQLITHAVGRESQLLSRIYNSHWNANDYVLHTASNMPFAYASVSARACVQCVCCSCINVKLVTRPLNSMWALFRGGPIYRFLQLRLSLEISIFLLHGNIVFWPMLVLSVLSIRISTQFWYFFFSVALMTSIYDSTIFLIFVL